MNETDVLTRVASHVDRQGHTFFVDSGYGSSVVEELSDSLENCNINRTITIGRRIPDIIGFTPQREIFAVEAKGTTDIRKGIGQAAYYRQGVHRSYLAAAKQSLVEFEQTALSCGIGLFTVDDTELQLNSPVANVGATQVDRTRRALAVRTSRFQSAKNSFPSMTRPENSLLPVIAIGSQDDPASPMTESQLHTEIKESDQRYNQSPHALSLARTLQLVERIDQPLSDLRIKLTDTGLACYYLLSGIVQRTSGAASGQDLYQFIQGIKNRTHSRLHELNPELASFFRDRYLSVPDVRVLVHVLSAHSGSKAELSRILAEIALSSPDAFLNLFCKRNKESDFRESVEELGPDADDSDFRTSLLTLVSPDAMYNFVYQIRHIGLLNEETQPVHQHDELAMDQFYWVWDADVVGELGGEAL